VRLDPEGNESGALAALAPELAGGRVLEIGSGDGRLTRRYADRARAVIATDPDQAALAKFERSMPAHLRERIELRAEPWHRLEPWGGPFTVVIFAWSL